MKQYLYNEKNGLWYELHDGHYLPRLKLPEEEQRPIGLWGQRHLRYLRQHRRVLYTDLLTSGKLNGYLADNDEQAEDMFSRLVNQMAEREGVTEKLKMEQPMLWIGRMNEIQARAREVVNTELIYG